MAELPRQSDGDHVQCGPHWWRYDDPGGGYVLAIKTRVGVSLAVAAHPGAVAPVESVDIPIGAVAHLRQWLRP
jgi:hypothetical protein